jgi:hypothetical protein
MGQVNSMQVGVGVGDTNNLDKKMNEQKVLDDMIDDTISLIKSEQNLLRQEIGGEVNSENQRIFMCCHCKKLLRQDSDEHYDCITDIDGDSNVTNWYCGDCHEFCNFGADDTIEEVSPEYSSINISTPDERDNSICDDDNYLTERVGQEAIDKWREEFIKRIIVEVECVTQEKSSNTIFPFMEISQSIEEKEEASLCRDEFLNKKDERICMIGVSMDRYSSKQQYMYRHVDGEIYTFWLKNDDIILMKKYIPVDECQFDEFEEFDECQFDEWKPTEGIGGRQLTIDCGVSGAGREPAEGIGGRSML